MERKTYRNPLSRQIIFGCVASVVMLCAVFGTVSYRIFNRGMMAQYEDHIRAIMNLAISQIDADDLDACTMSGVKSEKMERVIQFFDDVRQHYAIEYIVIVRPTYTKGKYDVMHVTSGLLPEERNGQNLKEMDIPKFGDMIGAFLPPDFIPQVYNEMLSQKKLKFSVTDTKFGRTYDGAVSIRNSADQGVALLTAGVSLKQIDDTMHRYILTMVLCTLVLGAIVLTILLIWLNRRIVVPLKKIEQTAIDFAEKSQGQNDPAALVLVRPEIHTGDELESLTDTLVSMSQNMKEYVQNLLTMKQTVLKMNDIAFRDSLTGVKSKAAYDKARERLDWDIVNHIAEFGIAMIDLNFLKRVNDSFGHEKGDIYIKKMCKLVCDIFDHSPVYRVGGDEFVVLLEKRDFDDREKLVAQLREDTKKFQNDVTLDPWERVSAAVGLAVFDQEKDENSDAVFKRADSAMYEEKKAMKAIREN